MIDISEAKNGASYVLAMGCAYSEKFNGYRQYPVRQSHILLYINHIRRMKAKKPIGNKRLSCVLYELQRESKVKVVMLGMPSDNNMWIWTLAFPAWDAE